MTQAITQMASHSDLTDEMKYCGHVEVAAFLLRHPDINKKKMCWNFLSGEAMPALECTLASQCREGVEGPKMVNMEKMMKLLFENGADATALDAEGDSMLENAAKRFYNGEINHRPQPSSPCQEGFSVSRRGHWIASDGQGDFPGGERPGHPGGVPRGEEEAEKIGESREVGCLEVPQDGGHSQDDGMVPYSGGVLRRGIVEENRIL